MALSRACFISYEYDKMVVLFSMTQGDKEIPCAISTSAMDLLEGNARARSRSDEREAQFIRLRDPIEACANRKYLASEFEGAAISLILRAIDFPAASKSAASR